jgi:hypothetical protein
MKKKSTSYDYIDTSLDQPEDRNFANELDDVKLKRVNPNRYDKKKDWYNYLNEHLHDDNISNRSDTTTLNKGARKIKISLSFNNPGFISTNEGMMLPEDIIDELTYKNYAYNRRISDKVTPESWKRMLNHGLDPVRDKDIIEKNNEKVDRMERRFQKELMLEKNEE